MIFIIFIVNVIMFFVINIEVFKLKLKNKMSFNVKKVRLMNNNWYILEIIWIFEMRLVFLLLDDLLNLVVFVLECIFW